MLFRRSVLTAAIVFAAIGVIDVLSDLPGRSGSRNLLAAVSLVLGLAGPVLVQGALVEIVRNIHEGKHPERIGVLFRRARARFWSMLLASIIYSVGVAVGLILLLVPGLIAAARWALMAPIVMLEGSGASSARMRSSELVRGKTGAVMGVVVVTYLVLEVPFLIVASILVPGAIAGSVAQFIWSSLTAPFAAHVLTVLYYRRTDPAEPVVHDDVFGWASVWETA